MKEKFYIFLGEESAEQIRLRADRLNIHNEDILFLGETDIGIIQEVIQKQKPKLVIIDSIQTMYSDEITSAPDDFSTLSEALEKSGLKFVEADIKMVPNNYVELDENSVKRMELILEKLDELDDVIDIYHNWDE